MNMKKKFTFLSTLAILLSLLLTSCGGFNAAGSWYMEEDEDAIINLEKDGRAVYYDAYHDESILGNWTLKDKQLTLTLNMYGESQAFIFKVGEDESLKAKQDGAEMVLVRGESVEVPMITLVTLEDNYWYSEDGDMELTFYSDGSWEIEDEEELETILEGKENSVTIEKEKVTLTADTGEAITAKISDDGTTLTLSNKMVFFMDQE